jgi:DNA (cytosine-5)-methyltransferase 1
MVNTMTELSLFTGAGGGILGSKLLGWTTIGYVEWNDYCQRVLRQRIEDGLIDNAPIFGDIRAFNSEGYAERYRGMVDVISAGFPCQPHSICGKRLGGADERNMWPETITTIRTVQPRIAWLENVTGLLTSGYFGTVIGDLSTSGYMGRYVSLGGGIVGSLCEGERLWIIAVKANGSKLQSLDFSKSFRAYPEESFRRKYSRAMCAMLSQDDYSRIKRDRDAVARGMERLKAIGNGQDPFLVRAAWQILSEGLI